MMANIAIVFHWQLNELKNIPIEELEMWNEIAVERGKP